jgi:hypothetical protein
MGLRNVREKSGSLVRAVFGGLSTSELISEIMSPDKESIDYASPIELGTYRLVTLVDRTNTEEDFLLPKESYERVERLLNDLSFHGFKKGIKYGNVYAHEYFGNPQFVSFIGNYLAGFNGNQRKAWPDDDHSFMRDKVELNLGKTLSHLSAAHLHLYHRPQQRKMNEDLEKLCQKIEKVFIPHFRDEKRAQFDYWL